MIVTVDLAAGRVAFEAHATAVGVDVGDPGFAWEGAFDASGSGVISRDWWLEGSASVEKPNWVVGGDGTVYEWEYGSNLVGYVSDDGASLELCWSASCCGPGLGALRASGRAGVMDLCAQPVGQASSAFPGGFTCTVVGEPLTRAEGVPPGPGPGEGGEVTTTSAGEDVAVGAGGDDTMVGDGDTGSVPAAQSGDGDEPVGTSLGGLILLVALLCGVVLAAALLWAFRVGPWSRMARDMVTGTTERAPGRKQAVPVPLALSWAETDMSAPVQPPEGLEPKPPPPQNKKPAWLLQQKPPRRDERTFVSNGPLAWGGFDDRWVRIEPGRPYQYRFEDNLLLVWIPEGSGGQWAIAPRYIGDHLHQLIDPAWDPD